MFTSKVSTFELLIIYHSYKEFFFKFKIFLSAYVINSKKYCVQKDALPYLNTLVLIFKYIL